MPPGTERPEPYGYPEKEGCFFRADESLPLWERYVGWHDWAVLLNGELCRLHNDARACLEGRHPVTQSEAGDGDLPFVEILMLGLPQFFLCVWELKLNGWARLLREDPVSRVLLEVRQARPVGRYRSAIDAAFIEAFTLICALELRPALRDGLTALRQRHARQQAAEPWCWLRFFHERRQAFHILCLLREELARYQVRRIVTPDQLRCERWHRAAQERLVSLISVKASINRSLDNVVPPRCTPGFDWRLTYGAPVAAQEIAHCILRCLNSYDHGIIEEELANEVEFFSAFQNRLDLANEVREFEQAERDAADAEAILPSDLPKLAASEQTPPKKLTFLPGGFIYRGHEHRLSGKPLQVLQALQGAIHQTITLKELQDKVWTDSEAGEEAVRSAVMTARKALRKALRAAHIQSTEDPILLVDRGTGFTAWRLNLP
jgi:hypothetical protein